MRECPNCGERSELRVHREMGSDPVRLRVECPCGVAGPWSPRGGSKESWDKIGTHLDAGIPALPRVPDLDALVEAAWREGVRTGNGTDNYFPDEWWPRSKAYASLVKAAQQVEEPEMDCDKEAC